MTNRYPDLIGPTPKAPVPWYVHHNDYGDCFIYDADDESVCEVNRGDVAAMIVELVNAEAEGITENVTSTTEGTSAGGLRVGDVLTADSPEPPVETVVADIDGDRWLSVAGRWRNSDYGIRLWEDLRYYDPVTVVKVGDGDE